MRDDLDPDVGDRVPIAWDEFPDETRSLRRGIWWQRVLDWATQSGADVIEVRAVSRGGDTAVAWGSEQAKAVVGNPAELSYIRILRRDSLLVVVNDSVDAGVIVFSDIVPMALAAIGHEG
jgi:hypothetical protein